MRSCGSVPDVSLEAGRKVETDAVTTRELDGLSIFDYRKAVRWDAVNRRREGRRSARTGRRIARAGTGLVAVVRSVDHRRQSANLDKITTLVGVGKPCPLTLESIDEVERTGVEGSLGNLPICLDIRRSVNTSRGLAVEKSSVVEPNVQDHVIRDVHLVAWKATVALAHTDHLEAVGNKASVSLLERPPLFCGAADDLVVDFEGREPILLSLCHYARDVGAVGTAACVLLAGRLTLLRPRLVVGALLGRTGLLSGVVAARLAAGLVVLLACLAAGRRSAVVVVVDVVPEPKPCGKAEKADDDSGSHCSNAGDEATAGETVGGNGRSCWRGRSSCCGRRGRRRNAGIPCCPPVRPLSVKESTETCASLSGIATRCKAEALTCIAQFVRGSGGVVDPH